MSEQLTRLQLQNFEMARDVAYAEKPGRDFLRDNPDLPRERVMEVAYEMGAAAAYAEMAALNDDYGWSFSLNKPYKYKTIPDSGEILDLHESPLVGEWAQIPGIKLINGRPVASQEDMNIFGRIQTAQGKTTQAMGSGNHIWSLLANAARSGETKEFIEQHPLYNLQLAYGRLCYFNAETAENAGHERSDHLDLYSLYELALQFPQLIKKPAGKVSEEDEWWFKGITRARATFVVNFLNETLQLEEPLVI